MRGSGAAGWALGGGAAAGGLLLWSTRVGPGLSPDSLKYLLVARSLGEGGGFSYLGEPMTHYPPLYPALLALIGAVDPDSLGRVRFLHAALLALAAALLAFLAGRAGGRGRTAAPLAILLLLASPEAYKVFVMAWSEALFVALTLGIALLLSVRLPGGGHVSLGGAAFCLALAPLTRYAGLAWVPAAVLACLLWTGCPRPRRVANAFVLGLAGLGLLSVWLLRNALLATSLTGRRLALHPPGLGSVMQLRDTAAQLWGLGEAPAGSALALLPLAAFLIESRRTARDLTRGAEDEKGVPASAAVSLFALLACGSYAALLLISTSVVDADMPLDPRLLMPVHVFAVVFVAALPDRLREAARRRSARAVLLFVIALGVVGLARTLVEADRLRHSGEGFSESAWRSSPALAGLRALPPGTPIFTNGPEIVAFFRGGLVAGIPSKTNRFSLESRPEYPRELQALCAAGREGALVVYLDGVTWDWETPTSEELQRACGLERVLRYEDGSLYAATR